MTATRASRLSPVWYRTPPSPTSKTCSFSASVWIIYADVMCETGQVGNRAKGTNSSVTSLAKNQDQPESAEAGVSKWRSNATLLRQNI